MHHRVITIIMRNIVGHIYDLYTLPQSTTLCHIYYIIAAAGSRKRGMRIYRYIPLFVTAKMYCGHGYPVPHADFAIRLFIEFGFEGN